MKPRVEYWDLFRDKDDSFHSRMRRGSGLIPPGTYHNTVEVIPTDMKGHILITRRAFSKHIGAGKYEFPAGSVLANEVPQQAAKRELFEETGLMPHKLYRLGAAKIPGVKKFVYLAYIPEIMAQKIVLQEGETIGYKFITYEQWIEMISNNLFEINYRGQFYTPGMYDRIQELVGTPDRFSPLYRAIRDKKQQSFDTIKPVERFGGTRGGLSAPDIFPVEDDAVQEQLFPFESELSEEEVKNEPDSVNTSA